jgi:glycosyltransferase involved in cell wall biosynthesis
MTLISVVIPVYNGSKTIQETITSVLNQTYYNLQIIVIDDGCTDSTLDIINSIKDHRLQVYSYSNQGLAISRNRGIDLAEGEYISFLDADDLWTENKLQSQLKALVNNPQADVACSWTNYIDEKGKIVFHGHRINLVGNVYPYLLLANMLDSGSNLFVRREKLLAIGKYAQSSLLKSVEDWDLYLRLASQYQFVTVPQAQILYRISSSSMSTDVTRIETSARQVIERAFTQAPASLQYLKKHSLANLYKSLIRKSLEQYPSPQQNQLTWQMLQQAIHYDPSLLYQPVILQIALKFSLANLLPTNIACQIFQQIPLIGNIRIGSCMRFYP